MHTPGISGGKFVLSPLESPLGRRPDFLSLSFSKCSYSVLRCRKQACVPLPRSWGPLPLQLAPHSPKPGLPEQGAVPFLGLSAAWS